MKFVRLFSYQRESQKSLMRIQDYMEQIQNADVSVSSGVLTASFRFGTYVINQQQAVQQLWLSSPISGPKKFKFNEATREWTDLRDPNSCLCNILENELSCFKLSQKLTC